MSRLITTTIVLLSLVGGGAALAQSSKMGGIPPAPIGHRQPTKADVSAAESKDKGQMANDAADKELDRKIKNICRGC